jgi:hypothetical protein
LFAELFAATDLAVTQFAANAAARLRLLSTATVQVGVGMTDRLGVRTLVTVLTLDEGVIELFEALRHRVTALDDRVAEDVHAACAAGVNGISSTTVTTATSEILRTA